MKAVAAFGLVLGMTATATMTAQAQITIPTVTVGDEFNSFDSSGYGMVIYPYAIGTYEVNLNQYTAFLNAVAATDTYSLYNTDMGTDTYIAGISRSGSPGSYAYSVIGSGLRPVTYVSWFDAARFSNWMANGQPTGGQVAGTTEDGAYTLNGATSGVDFRKNAINPNTGATTSWWIPSEDEWYKAAYYDPGVDPLYGYWLYPTRSDSAPGNMIGAGTNQANYFAGDYAVTQSPILSSSQSYLTDGGAFSASGSYFGTFDQGGNVGEWNDAVIGSSRGLRGGSWSVIDAFNLRSSSRNDGGPANEGPFAGFRVASVPEPSTAVLMLLGGGAWLLWRRRRVTL